jgi:hypothetical protein
MTSDSRNRRLSESLERIVSSASPGVDDAAALASAIHQREAEIRRPIPDGVKRDLSEWIDRLIEFCSVNYGYMPGGIGGLDTEFQRDVLPYYQRLNSSTEWATRGLSKLDFPNGHPTGYLGWDGLIFETKTGAGTPRLPC